MNSLLKPKIAFRGDASGNVAVTFGLLLTLLLVGSGAAVDFGRWHMAKTSTMSALDAAVLAGGRALQLDPENSGAALTVARRYYDENVRNRLTLSDDTVDFVITDNQRAIAATGAAHIETTLLALAGIDRLPVVNHNAARLPKAKVSGGESGGSNIEVALALDVTGSMCSDGVGPCTSSAKLTGLKEAAKDLIDIVVWADQSNRTSRVALVPFSTRVRVGQDGDGGSRMQLLTDLDPTWSGWYNQCVNGSGSGGSEGNGNWTCNQYQAQYKNNWKIMPCVTDRFYNNGWTYDLTDDAPTQNRWLNAHDGGRMTRSWDSSNTGPGNQRGVNQNDPATHWNYTSNGQCADVAEDNEILPLTDNKQLLKDRIDDLEAYGSTAGALGTMWSWYMLSPKWNTVWASGEWPGAMSAGSYADVQANNANGTPVLRKVAVILSDGVFNTYRSWKDQNQQQVSDYAKQTCANMKAQGIEIYTVGFALQQLNAAERAIAEDTLRSCGTDVEHFYNTLNVDQLKQAFRDIALELSTVYLTR